MLAVAALLVLAPPAAAAPPVRGADYVTTFSGDGNLSFSVSKDGKRLLAPQGGQLPAVCSSRKRRQDLSFTTFIYGETAGISAGGRFSKRFLGEEGPWLRGTFRPGGKVRGRISYRIRSCRAILNFTGWARRPGRGLPGLAFSFGGAPNARLRDGRPATSTAISFDVAVDQLPDGSLVVAEPSYDRSAGCSASSRVAGIAHCCPSSTRRPTSPYCPVATS